MLRSVDLFFISFLLLKIHTVIGQADCVAKNCIVSQWTEWSQCSGSCGVSGLRKRDRQVLQPESCGGTCGKTEESEACNRKCCPKNCAYTPWTKWGSCNCYSSRCDEVGERIVCYRFRDKESDAACGGYCDNVDFELLCKEPCCYKDCILGAWGQWGACDAPCETPGISTREREKIQLPDCGGKRCKEGEEQKKCMGPCCPVDCVLGPWGDWTECPAVCGEANITRSRTIKHAECNGKDCNEKNVIETKKCSRYINTDCKMSSWSSWSNCTLHNGKCGEGSKTRTREVAVQPKCRGEPCGNTTETHVCYGECCRTDCVVSEWSEYGHCSINCGKGVSTRNREVVTEQACGGTACPVLSESKDCEVVNKVDCSFTEWSNWTTCSTRCGKGKQMRSRTLITPAYCGGNCESKVTDQEQACESYAARKDCEVTQWTQWSEVCIRDCENGRKYKNRTILENPQCGGKECPSLFETRTCHPKCSQLCNQGECSCKTGYELQSNGYSCKKVDCGKVPGLLSCAPGTKFGTSCFTVTKNCSGMDYGSVCEGSCSASRVLKGSQTFTTCQEDGEWSNPKFFCGPQNKAPVNLSINTGELSELVGIDECFAKLTTQVDDESWDKHTYSFVKEPSGSLKIMGNRVCVKIQLDYETSKYRKWNATIRSTDLDGLTVDNEFAFTLVNNNDPPRSAELHPYKIPENSMKGTEIGCFTTKDDDEGQILTVVQLTSKDLFELYQKPDGTYCTKLIAESDPSCPTIGGTHCKMNFEDHPLEYFAILVADDGTPPLKAYFDIKVELTNVEEPVTGIKSSVDFIRENVPAGQPLITLTAVDEDKDSTHKFEIVEDSSGLFKVVDDKIVATEVIDYESHPGHDYELKIRVTETNSLLSSMEQSISFYVTDANESPFNLSISSTNAMESFEVNKPKVKENVADVVIGTLTVSDPDMSDSIQFLVNHENFTIRNSHCSHPKTTYCSAQLIHTVGFDFEAASTFNVEVTAMDKFKVPIKLQFDIELIDMNDPPTDILLDGKETAIIEIPENSKDFEIATLSTQDQDKDSNPSFFLLGAASSLFVIKGKMLKTTETARIDFETLQPIKLIIRAEDNGLQIEKTFDIKVSDVNEPPTSIEFSENKLKENSVKDTLVSKMSGIDPDSEQKFTYKLLDDAHGRFYVKENKLFVKESTQLCDNLICSLNFEKDKEMKIQVEVTDNGNPPLSTVVTQTILLEDENDPPYGLKITSSHLRENKPKGSTVGILLASDEDRDDLSFTLLGHTSEFEIVQGNQLVSRIVFDYETTNEYRIKVQVSDDATPQATYEDTIKIIIDGVNDAPQFIGTNTFTVREGVDIQSIIATLSILDPDQNDVADVRLINYDKVFFLTGKKSTQQAGEGTLTTITLTPEIILDYEKQQTYDIDLDISDTDGLMIFHKILVNIEDVNDEPEDILLNGQSSSSLSVEEEQIKTLGTLSAVDQDKGQTHVFTVKSQTQDHFVIEGNQLKLSKALDYEETPSLSITIEVKDSAQTPLTFEKTFTVSVSNKNEPPSSLRLVSKKKVPENSIDATEVGRLVIEDPDNSEGFDFTLLDDANGFFRIEGDKVLVVAPKQCIAEDTSSCTLNFEKQKSYTIKVVVKDPGFQAQSVEFELAIDITDVNDAPTNIALSGTQVEELAPVDTKIGDISVTDEDDGQTHTFSLKDVTGDMFKLDSNGKAIIKASSARLDVSQIYSVVVVATDNGNPSKSVEEKYFISVLGVSEAPQNVILTASKDANQINVVTVSIPESFSTKAVIGTVSGEDNDLDQTMSFSLLENPDDVFEIGDNTDCKTENNKVKCSVSLLLSKAVNFEAKEKYSLTLLASDSENVKASKNLIVQISDVPEPPKDVIFSKKTISVPENSQDTILGRFTYTDEDKQDSHIFSLVKDGGGNFAVDGSSGTLSVKNDAALNFEENSSVKITVKVTDSADNAVDKEFEISILDVNEPVSSVTLSKNTIPENSKKDTLVGLLQSLDPDNLGRDDESKQKFEYSLLNDANGKFILDGASVLVSAKGSECNDKECGLDFEGQASHEIEVQVKDSGSPQLSSSFKLTVTVSDENDAPMLGNIDVLQLREDMNVEDEITELSATDQDKGQIITFSLGDEQNELFKVEGNKLILAGKLDFEDKPTVSVSIVAQDNGIPPQQMQRRYDFDVTDIEEPPSLIYVQSVEDDDAQVFPQDKPVIGENAESGSVIAQLVVIDPDKEEDISVIISGDDIAADPPGCLTLTKGTRCVSDILLKQPLDFEKKKQFTVTITALDKNGGELKKDVLFSIKDQNDPPRSILLDEKDINILEVNENIANADIATMSSIDPDADETFSFEVTGSSQFYIVGNKLWVASATQLDYETSPEITFKIKVSDSGVPPLSLEKQVTVKVIDVNETPSKVSLTRSQVAENSAPDTKVGTFFTSDPDNSIALKQSFSYELIEDGDGMFYTADGELKVQKQGLDYEESNMHLIKVRVTDSGSPAQSAEFEFKISITDSNDPPNNLKLSEYTVIEDASLGTEIGRLSADDFDKGQAVSFSIDNSDKFIVRDNALVVNGDLDFESQPTVAVEVTATDNGIPAMKISKTFTVTVTDANDAPAKISFVPSASSKKMEIDEGLGNGHVIGTVKVFDADTVDQISLSATSHSSPLFKFDDAEPKCVYEKVSEMNNAKYTICSLNVLLSDTIKYSSDKPSLTLEVKATDKGDLTSIKKWDIQIVDKNDPPTDITISSENLEVQENMFVVKLGELRCADPDRDQKHIFQIITYWEIFKVEKGSLLSTFVKLDAEKQSEYKVSIRCVDNGKPEGQFIKTFTIKVKDVNEKPTDISLSHLEVPMTAKDGDRIALIEVIDPDNTGSNKEKQKHSCNITKDDSDSFKISDDSKELLVKGKVPVENETVELEIECTDDGTPEYSFAKIFTLMITENADVPKAIVFHSKGGVNENAQNVEAGHFSVINELTESDVKGEFVYSDLTISGAEIDYLNIEGNKLLVKKPINFEKYLTLSGTIKVKGKDLSNNAIELDGNFKFKINDVNEAPTEIRVYGGGLVEENSPTGTEIGNLNTVDPEPYQTYTYKLLSVSNGLDVSKSSQDLFDVFVLEKSTLKVGLGGKALDFEQNPTWSLLVQTMDSGSPPIGLNYTVRIIVVDANDAPTKVSLDSNTIPENAKVKQVVGKLKVEDPDNGQNHHCVVNNLQDVPFTVENGLDLVVSQETLDFESQRTYVVEVTCEDDGGDGSHLKITASISVSVLNVNEPPHNITLSKLEIEEGNEIDALVAVIQSSDPDSKQTFFSIDENGDDDWEYFSIKGDSSLTAKTAFDFEKKSTYSITITAKDEGGLANKQTFSIKVVDKNEKPTSISLTNNIVDENAERGTLIGQFRTEDQDQKQTFVYTLSEKSGATGHFVIVGDRLEVGATNLDHEEDDSHLIIITSMDSGKPPLKHTMECTIQVKDENEAPSEITIEEPVVVEENVDQQTKVADITVIDEEADQKHACKILTSPAPFKIQTTDTGKIQLVVSGLIDFEKQKSYNLNISCSDGEFSIHKSLKVEVKNLNEPPTRIQLHGPQALPAIITTRYEVGELVVDDEDIGQTHIFTTSGANSDILKVEGGNQLVLIKTIPKKLLDKPNPQMNIIITVMDSGAGAKPFVQVLTLPITGIDLEALKLPEITLDNTEIDEEAVAGDMVGEIFDRNETVHDHVIFSIKDDEQDMFEINDRFLVLTKSISLSTPNSVEVTIQALDKQTQETKERTVTFIISRSNKCWKDGRVCHENARCTKVNETYHECRCKEDFKGDGYACEQIDDCAGDIEEKCGAHGDCVDDLNSFVCNCKDDYKGKNCEQAPPSANPCYKNQCQNDAACAVNKGEKNYTCVCSPGWTGDHCTGSLDECEEVAEPCLGNGICVDGHLSYSCNCSEERYGQKCQFFKVSCMTDSCNSDLICIPKINVSDKTCVSQNENNTLTIQVKCDSGHSNHDCINKFIYFVDKKRRYLSQDTAKSGSSTRKKRSGYSSIDETFGKDISLLSRDKRAVSSINSEILNIYATDIKNGPDGYIVVTFIVTDDKYQPKDTKEIVSHLEEVCKSVEPTNLIETEYCPKVIKAVETYKQAQEEDPDVTGDGDNNSDGDRDGNGDGDDKDKDKGDDKNGSCKMTSFSFGGGLVAVMWIIASLLI